MTLEEESVVEPMPGGIAMGPPMMDGTGRGRWRRRAGRRYTTSKDFWHDAHAAAELLKTTGDRKYDEAFMQARSAYR